MVAAGWQHEKELWKKGHTFVAGTDEVGRGAWAGPVVTAAVVFYPETKFPEELFDSKLISPTKRNRLSQLIKKLSLSYSFGVVGVPVINKIGIGEATQKAFRLSLKNLSKKAEFILIDAFYIKSIRREQQRPIKHGDRLCASIAAASIIAKVFRDNLMVDLDKVYPGYGFGLHKGYGTRLHQEALKEHNFSPVHRRSFKLEAYLPKLLDQAGYEQNF